AYDQGPSVEKPGRPANTTHPRTTTAVPAQINERATAHRWIEAEPPRVQWRLGSLVSRFVDELT
ncbi:hypothetical protein, partial [Cellulomonas fimi]|uniref:hypothetical protein n=1 Tax=Cellulomonas fimi TaxID=1708 RepID=UPI001B87368A